jgi:Na+/proline symporter
MTVVDGFVLGAYFLLVVGISGVLMLRQRTAEDYYLGGRRVPAGLIAGSIVATQASAVSLVGGPAFVALRPDGGLRWLQYELALPLAMAALLPLVAALHRWRVLSIYEFLEFRLGRPVRVAVSVLFQVSRALATGVSLYTTALIFHVVLDVPLMWTVLAIGGVSLLYTLMWDPGRHRIGPFGVAPSARGMGYGGSRECRRPGARSAVWQRSRRGLSRHPARYGPPGLLRPASGMGLFTAWRR